MMITAKTSIHEIATQFPNTIQVLQGFGIDYRGGGEDTLQRICTARGLNPAFVLEALTQHRQDETAPDPQWEQALLTELAEYIVRKHHAFTREQIKLIDDLMTEVEHRHGHDRPEVFQIGKIFAVLSAELMHHFYWEENILFPYIAQLGTGQQPGLPPVFGGLDQPVARMMMEHDQTGKELRILREITNNYAPPRVVCPTWRALYRALEGLERDLRQHIHLENHILFPRALKQVGEDVQSKCSSIAIQSKSESG